MTFLRLTTMFLRGGYSIASAVKKAARLTWRGF